MVDTEKVIFRTLNRILINAPNAYLQSLLNMQELIENGDIPQNVSTEIHPLNNKRPDNEHVRRFNQPISNEVTILLPNQTTHCNSTNNLTIICSFRPNKDTHDNLQCFKDTHSSYDCLCYPRMFPYGTDGFHLRIPQTEGRRTVTAKQFHAYRPMKHIHSFNVLHHCNRLFNSTV